jgi:hypothetical protein
MKTTDFDHFQRQPTGCRALYTMTLLVLGTGYLFAMIQTFHVHAGRDGKPGLSHTDIQLAYSGSQADTRLEAALKGPMSGMIKSEDAAVISGWVRSGAEMEAFQENVLPLMQAHCLGCHGGDTEMRKANPHIPNLDSYENVMKMVQLDTGQDIYTMVRVSHIHLFGMTFIFFIMGSIFLHAQVKPKWLKCLIIITPFIAIFVDIMSWYLTKLYQPFSWVVYSSGVFMAAAFTIQWFTSIYQLWFYRLPEEAADSGT